LKWTYNIFWIDKHSQIYNAPNNGWLSIEKSNTYRMIIYKTTVANRYASYLISPAI